MRPAEREKMLARIAELIAELETTERKVSIEATGSPNTIRYMRTRGTTPSFDKLTAIAAHLGVSPFYLAAIEDDRQEYGRTGAQIIRRISQRIHEADIDVEAAAGDGKNLIAVGPLLRNTVEKFESIGGGTNNIRTYRYYIDEPKSYLTLPPALDGRGVTGFVMPDHRMAPWIENGETLICAWEPNVAIIGRDSVVHLKLSAEGEPGAWVVIIARISGSVRGQFIVLEQSDPPSRFKIPVGQIESVATILTMDEALALPATA